jgi:hypothetical protein
MPSASNANARCSGSSGSSIGWVENQNCARSCSDGRRCMPVVSVSAKVRAASSSAHAIAAAHAMPHSTETICRSGSSSRTPEQMSDIACIAIVLPFQTCISR